MQAAALWVLALYNPFRHLNGDLVGATVNVPVCIRQIVTFCLYGWDCTWFLPRRMGNNGWSSSRALFYFQC